MANTDELLQLKKKLESKRTERTRLEAQRDQLSKILKEEYGLESIEAAQDRLAELGEEIARETEVIDRETEELKAKYADLA